MLMLASDLHFSCVPHHHRCHCIVAVVAVVVAAVVVVASLCRTSMLTNHVKSSHGCDKPGVAHMRR
jgi:hypothetical protein